METRSFDEEFEEAVAEWRSRHRLAEDDAVLLLLELFRLHQRHWDEIRRRELPSFEQFRSDIAKLSEAAKAFQRDSTALLEVLRSQPPRGASRRVSLSVATVAVILALLAGILIGKALT
jgi:hypothetical protein